MRTSWPNSLCNTKPQRWLRAGFVQELWKLDKNILILLDPRFSNQLDPPVTCCRSYRGVRRVPPYGSWNTPSIVYQTISILTVGLTVTVALAEVHPHIGRIQLFIPDFKNMLTNVASSILMLKLRLCSMENLAAFILNVQPVKVYHFNASFFFQI